MTYSIVARDPKTRELGVAVQSHYFSVGPVVPWVEAGVGAIATQANVEIAYGPRGLDLLRAGKRAGEALKALVAEDDGGLRRQVAFVDVNGNAAAHTGNLCIPYAGHLIGDGVSVQANMMERDTVPAAMLATYQSTSGELADRLLAALDAAEAEGGDIRGRQSAAILVCKGEKQDEAWRGRVLELRVEDHPEPLVELRRLVQIQRAYRVADESENAATAGDQATAAAKMMEALRLAPGNPEIAFWSALGAATAGQLPLAKKLLADALAADPRWIELARRMPATGMLPGLTDEVVQELVGD